jgi:hypothetical protein
MSLYGATKQSNDIHSKQTDGNKAIVLCTEPYPFFSNLHLRHA